MLSNVGDKNHDLSLSLSLCLSLSLSISVSVSVSLYLSVSLSLSSGYEVIIFVYDVINKILLRDSNYVIDAVM